MRTFLALSLLSVVVFANATDAADIRSGVAVGSFPKAYTVVDVTGPAAGTGPLCYRCRYGAQPVVNIFARKLDDNVIRLIKQIDNVVGKHRDHRMAAFVVLLTDEPEAQQDSLRKVAESSGLQHTPLTIYSNSAGPGSYRISKEADITVMMWVDQEVKVNHALRAADLNDQMITKIAGDTARVFLLVLVTAFFMAAWDGDQAAMQAALARRANQQSTAVAAAVNTDVPSTRATQHALKTVSVPHERAAGRSVSPRIPLPKGIAAGTYQAVNQAGTSIRLDVDEPGGTQPRDFYMVDTEDGHRWYLIRVTQ